MKKPEAKKPAASVKKSVNSAKKPAPASKSKPAKKPAKPVKRFEPKLESPIEESDALETVTKYFKSEDFENLNSAKWQDKKVAMESMVRQIMIKDDAEIAPIIVMHLLNKKPGFKDTNFNTINARFLVVKQLAENQNFGTASLNLCLESLVTKLGDLKCKTSSTEALYNIAEHCSTFTWLANRVLKIAFHEKQRSPKIQEFTLIWIHDGLEFFGLPDKSVLVEMAEFITKGIESKNVAVKNAAVKLVSKMMLYRRDFIMFFNKFLEEKTRDSKIKIIEEEFEKIKDSEVPKPSRVQEESESEEEEEDEAEGPDGAAEAGAGGDAPVKKSKKAKEPAEDAIPDSEDELLTAIDLSLPEDFLKNIQSKIWKERSEAITAFKEQIDKGMIYKPSSFPDDLFPKIGILCKDANKNIAIAAFKVMAKMVELTSTKFIISASSEFYKNFILGLSDTKIQLREAAVLAGQTWMNKHSKAGVFNFIENSDPVTAFKTKPKPLLKATYLNMISDLMLKTKPNKNVYNYDYFTGCKSEVSP